MNILDNFNFPTRLLINQKLTKKSFYDMGSLSSAQQKALQEQVESIWLSAQLTPDKTNIPKYKTDKYEYIECLVIEVQLKNHQAWLNLSLKQLKTLHEIFHKAIPYALILILHSGVQSQLSLAEKFINQADSTTEKLIMGDLVQTSWINLNNLPSEEQQFLNVIRYNQLNKQNLYQLYQSLIQRFTALLLAKQTGKFELTQPTDQNAQTGIDQQRQKLKVIMQLDREITELKNRIENCIQFNEKVELNMQLQKLNTQLKQVKEA